MASETNAQRAARGFIWNCHAASMNHADGIHSAPQDTCDGCAALRGKADAGEPRDGLTVEDLAQILDTAKLRRVRMFKASFVFKGTPVTFDLTFEPEPKPERRGHNSDGD